MTTPTREELLKLAKEVANIGIKGDDDARSSNYFIFSEPMLERFAALLSAHQAQSAGFPARIYDLLTEVASRVPPEGRGVWEDGNGEPLQDDADAALAWIDELLRAQPTAQQVEDARDAARYRWLRNEAIRDYVEFSDAWYEDGEDLDAAVDALQAGKEKE